MKGRDSVDMKLGAVGTAQSMQPSCLPTVAFIPPAFLIRPISSRPEISNQNASLKQWNAESKQDISQ
jgi:hypothetical protein